MKRIFTLIAAVLFTVGAFTQAPQKMSYQAVVRNASGELQTNQAVGMKISILQGSTTGTPVYVETHTTTTNANGLITIEIGNGAIVTGTFGGIDWAAGTYFIKTETDPTGGTNYSIAGTSQILSVPYAMYAKTAKTANYNDLTNKPSLFDGTWTSLTGKPSLANVATSGNYLDLTNRPTIFDGTWTSLTGQPTTLAGYGITNAMSTSHPANNITASNITNWNTAYGWGNHAGLYRPVTYVPAWSEITSKPTTIAGYGITDAMSTSHPANNISSSNITNWNTAYGWGNHAGLYRPVTYVPAWSEITNKPTTIVGYGITNAMSTSHPANNITASNITNWNTAYGWGNHAGLYRPVTYVPAWSEITSKPTTLAGYGITNVVTAQGTHTITGKSTFKGTTTNMEEPLFEVKNETGQTIFAVYNEGVRMWVDNTGKGTKSGFAVQGFDNTDFMVIKSDSTNFYVREAGKAVPSTFNIIGIRPSTPRKSLLMASTDILRVSSAFNLQNNLFVDGNIDYTGTISTLNDIDGNSYRTVTIGTQVWMAENLKTTRLNDGTSIPLVTSSTTWGTLLTPGYCLYNNNEAFRSIYGVLYNWYTVNTGKLCPTGWHIPSNTEWTVLTDYLGGQSIAGGKLKETGTTHWTTPNTAATDEVDFTALPGGARGGTGDFGSMGNYGYWWTTNPHSVDPSYAWGFVLQYNLPDVIRADYYYKRDGFSVRCLKN